jgi:hypothetical protein
MNATLDAFNQPPARDMQPEATVPLDASRPVIRNWKLVVLMVQEAFAKNERVQLLLDSNGTMDKPATAWRIRRVVS